MSRTRYDWSRGGHPGVARFNRAGSWVLICIAAATWVLSPLGLARDWTLVFAPLLPTAGVIVQRAALRKVYGVKEARPAVAQPEPREPRDTSRPYPRPEGRNKKLNRVCPVCGTGRETGDLDGRLLGWRAHRTCAEFLGDWKPVVVVAGTRLPLPPRSICVSGSLSGIASTGDRTVSVQSDATFHAGTVYADMYGQWRSDPDPGRREEAFQALKEMRDSGYIALDEARAQIDREITDSGGMARQRILAETLRKAGVQSVTLTHASMVGHVKRVGAADIWYIVCTCGVTIHGTLTQMPQLTFVHACKRQWRGSVYPFLLPPS